MWRLETAMELSDGQRAAVVQLLSVAQDHDGVRPLSDQLWLDLVDGSAAEFAATLAFDDHGHLGAYAQLARTSQSSTIELVVAPNSRRHRDTLSTMLLRAMLDHVAVLGGGAVYWWVLHPDEDADAIAATVGLQPGRRLYQLRRDLPVADGPSAPTRAFRVGRDDSEWLRVNNAAFFDHPEQGAWTADTLRQREAEPWFDPEGFLLHERDGKLAAFCWTKVHDDTTPPMGEIYVIAVDPSFHGLGLGRALTMAGLHHLGGRGLTVAMLYVDAANVAAMSMYQRLGFNIHHADHAYTAEIPAGSARSEHSA
jgi:mycothiol synthase